MSTMSVYDNMDLNELLKLFKEQLLNFVDELIETFPNEGNLILLRVYIDTQLIIEKSLSEFTDKINENNEKLKQMIKQRNENFFIKYDLINLESKNEINYMLKLWQDDILQPDDKSTIWDWVDLFVKISDSFLLKQ
jgi:hypothetical protein